MVSYLTSDKWYGKLIEWVLTNDPFDEYVSELKVSPSRLTGQLSE